MSVYSSPPRGADTPSAVADKIRRDCTLLTSAITRGELGKRIAEIALLYSPGDIQQMKRNFGEKLRDITPEYRRQLEMKITGHLPGVWQTIGLMHRQGSFSPMNDPLPGEVKTYWDMVAGQCSAGEGGEEIRLRFLKFLIAGFSMFVQHEPGHPVGTPFPGGDTVQYTNGIYYCPVREKADDVDAALCPFCPALQTPEISYLKPPTNPSEHRKQEFIRHCHDFHNFNG